MTAPKPPNLFLLLAFLAMAYLMVSHLDYEDAVAQDMEAKVCVARGSVLVNHQCPPYGESGRP